MFAFIPAADGICELAVIQPNVRTALAQCSYRPVSLKTVFHAHLQNVQYLFFPNLTTVILKCQNGVKQLVVKGHYKAPDYCEITCSTLRTLPTHQHFALNRKLKSALIPLPIMNFTIKDIQIVSEKLKVLAFLNETHFADLNNNLPFYLSREFALPSLTIPSILLILAIMFLFCYYRAVSSKFNIVHNILTRTTQKSRSPVVENTPTVISPA